MDFISLWMKGENSKTNFTHELWIKLREFSSKVFYLFTAKFEVFHRCPTIYVGVNWCHPWHYICECTTKQMMEIWRIITNGRDKGKDNWRGLRKEKDTPHCIEGDSRCGHEPSCDGEQQEQGQHLHLTNIQFRVENRLQSRALNI